MYIFQIQTCTRKPIQVFSILFFYSTVAKILRIIYSEFYNTDKKRSNRNWKWLQEWEIFVTINLIHGEFQSREEIAPTHNTQVSLCRMVVDRNYGTSVSNREMYIASDIIVGGVCAYYEGSEFEKWSKNYVF